jgi:uncharacterized protein (DUF2062 family)
MPRKLLKRMMPEPAKIKENKSLNALGKWVHDPNLWHLTRHSASMAFLVGLFAALLPTPGQTLIAAALAVVVRGNLPIAVVLTWVTNPLTAAAFAVLAYNVGAWLLGSPPLPTNFTFSFDDVFSEVGAIAKPFLLGSVVTGALLGCIGCIAIRLLWRWHVVRQWEARKRRRAAGTEAR